MQQSCSRGEVKRAIDGASLRTSAGDAFQDSDQSSGGECGVPTAKRYVPPASPWSLRQQRRSSKAPGPLYYSFDRGSVHFVVLDSEMPSDPASEQGR